MPKAAACMADVLMDMTMPAEHGLDACLTPLPRAAQWVFRGDAAAARAAGAALGLDLPVLPCSSARCGPRAALWQGPDEWLLLAPEDQESDIEAAVAEAVADIPYALVGVGHRNVAFSIAGHRAAAVLNTGCPLDLDLSAFPRGMCTRTVLGRAQIVLWRTDDEEFHVTVWRSFFPYVREFLLEGRRRL
jgi:sarcosine oxidase subunit gamma